jgi:hypothetical protein
MEVVDTILFFDILNNSAFSLLVLIGVRLTFGEYYYGRHNLS